MMLENERLVKKFANATKDSKVVFMTCSGSGGMEAAEVQPGTDSEYNYEFKLLPIGWIS